MIYTCECGYAQPVKLPFVPGVSEFKYYPNEKASRFKMFYQNDRKVAELRIQCPNCNTTLFPDNANSGKNYKACTLERGK